MSHNLSAGHVHEDQIGTYKSNHKIMVLGGSVQIPGKLVPGLVEQNYKRHHQQHNFTVRLSQVTSVTFTSSFFFFWCSITSWSHPLFALCSWVAVSRVLSSQVTDPPLLLSCGLSFLNLLVGYDRDADVVLGANWVLWSLRP